MPMFLLPLYIFNLNIHHIIWAFSLINCLQQFMTSKNIPVWFHLLYSPNLAFHQIFLTFLQSQNDDEMYFRMTTVPLKTLMKASFEYCFRKGKNDDINGFRQKREYFEGNELQYIFYFKKHFKFKHSPCIAITSYIRLFNLRIFDITLMPF